MPIRRSTVRTLAGAAFAALAASIVFAGAAPVAVADFAGQCSTPDRTITSNASSISVAAGETVLISGVDFTAGLDALPAAGTVCVASGAGLSPAYLNNAAGAIVVAAGGTLALPSIAVSAGFSLELEGTATIQGLNINGAATIHIAAGAELTMASTFAPSAGEILNEGTLVVNGTLDMNSSTDLDNRGTIRVSGDGDIDGSFENTGAIRIVGGIVVNGSGSMYNGCVLLADGPLVNDSATASNAGVVVAGGGWTNNGTWRQAASGILGTTTLVDDGEVLGFGTYLFEGETRVQGTFAGDSAGSPIVVDTVAPTGQIFDEETGTIANVVRVSIADLDPALQPAPDCAAPLSSAADVVVQKDGPATVEVDGAIEYTITVRNDGPDAATGVVVSDTLPPELVAPVAVDGSISGGVASWDAIDLAVGESATFTVTGTAPSTAGAQLLDVARATSTSGDPDPGNNNGTDDAARVTTLVVDDTPANNPPVAPDLALVTTTGFPLFGAVLATDPDTGQTLRYGMVPATGPDDGVAGMLPSGLFVYESDDDFTGIDDFDYQVCDNGEPQLCDTGTITITVWPVADDDIAETPEDTAVTIPVGANDTLGAALDPVPVVGPSDGDVTLVAATRSAVYTPDPGFVGVDTFQYENCSPSVPTLCDTATVTVTVRAVNHPPVIDPVTLTTVTDVAVSGPVIASDPDGDAIALQVGQVAVAGTLTLAGTTATYQPAAGFAGHDSASLVVCDDGTPVLCATGPVSMAVSPVAADDTASTTPGTAVTIPVETNDRGLVGPATVVDGPENGSVVVDGDGFRYTPDAGFTGTDTFSYVICTEEAQLPPLCADAEVTVTVAAPVPPDPDGIADTGASVTTPALLAGIALLGGGLLLAGARLRRTSRVLR